MYRVHYQLIATLLLCISPLAQASLFTMVVDSTVQRAGRPGYVDPGEHIQLYFSYQSAQPDIAPEVGKGVYSLLAGEVRIGSYTYLLAPLAGTTDPILGELGGINIFDDYSLAAEGLFVQAALSGPNLGEYYPTEALLSLANFSGADSGTITGDALITESFDPANFVHSNALSFEFEEEIFPGFFGRVAINGVVERLTIIDVPIPPIGLLMLCPIAFLLATRTHGARRGAQTS